MADSVRYLHTRLLPTADLEAAWQVYGDTDSFNRHAGLHFRFQAESTPDGRKVRVGRVRRFGLELDWVDEPFEIEAPRRFVSRRRFRRGPVRTLTTRMELKPSAEGIQLVYSVELEPVAWWAAPLVQMELATSIRPMLDRTLADAAAVIGGGRYRPPQRPEEEGALTAALADLASRDALLSTLREGDLRAQDTLRPLAIARRWGLAEEVVVQDMVVAAQRGALEMSFDLLCPSCRGPTTRMKTLAFEAGRRHCTSCEIALDGTFPDEVEVTFRPARQHRPEPPPLDCVHSPSHTPHVRARWLLAPHQELATTFKWEPGSWRLRSDPDFGQDASVEVRSGLAPRGILVELGSRGLAPSRLSVAPGEGEVIVRNQTDQAVYVELHYRARRADLLTVGRLLDLTAAREGSPSNLLPPFFRPARAAGVLVLDAGAREVDLDRAIRAAWRRSEGDTYDLEKAGGPVATHRADGAFLAVFEQPVDAWIAARRVLPAPQVGVVVTCGDVGFLPSGEATWPVGGTVDRAVRLARAVGPGRFAVPLEESTAGPLADILAKAGVRAVAHPEISAALLPVPPAPAGPSVWPEKLGGRFLLGPALARGGMGVVRAGKDLQTGDEVVLKTLSPEASSDPLHIQRFLWEARLTSRVRHPHCVRILDYGCDGDLPWMALERLEGTDLADRLRGAPRVPVQEAIGIVLDVLEGLQAAHDGGVVHRDVKPGNIWLSPTPRPDHARILDFGIAVSVDDADAPEDGRLIGSPRYMSPEQVAREPVDGRTDVYACATVLFEMITGQAPFSAPDARTMALRRLAGPAPPASTINPDVPDSLSRILERALARDPGARWESPRALAAALYAWRTTSEGDTPPQAG
jgi:serine/threonine-protein kinase